MCALNDSDKVCGGLLAALTAAEGLPQVNELEGWPGWVEYRVTVKEVSLDTSLGHGRVREGQALLRAAGRDAST